MVGIRVKGLNQYGDGKCGFGSVYLATPKISRSRYNYYPSIMTVKSVEFSASTSIQKEIMVFSDLQGCPDYIITCYGEETTIGDNDLMAFNLLLEYASGGTLSDRIKKSGGSGLPEFEAKEYTMSILRGLDHIHTTGYVHCDLKPDNILLVRTPNDNNEFQAKIGDFGLAKRAEVQSKKRRLDPYWRGTPMYLSPEAVIDRVQEAPCDNWAHTNIYSKNWKFGIDKKGRSIEQEEEIGAILEGQKSKSHRLRPQNHTRIGELLKDILQLIYPA
ncbi:hypothetical protein ACJIZ3_021275 [Penstemon smallii]|uniref:Protein kinase domain-containing protein n=1 Tax=Penstemon smallii TaxID=265156 RepID=A0ABD3SKY4_9LAMI